MKQLFPAEMPAHEREQRLQSMAYSVEETTYYKPLTQEELDERREKLADNVIKLSKLETEKKSFIESHKIKVKPFQEENAELLKSIDTKQEEVEGVLYHIDDQESGVMDSYDANGVLVASRRLRPDERQTSIFSINNIAQ